jgi:hypothetical protein
MYRSVIKLRSALLVYLTHKMALPVLKIIRRPEQFPYCMNQLMQMEDGSLGKALGLFIKEKGLALLPHYARHDLKHILLQYDTTDEGEVCLQCFMLGNGHISFPVIATVLFGLFTMPEHWLAGWYAFKRGRSAASVVNWNWFEIVPVQVQKLRANITTSSNLQL